MATIVSRSWCTCAAARSVCGTPAAGGDGSWKRRCRLSRAAGGTPLLRDLDADGRPELAAIGLFARGRRFFAAPDSLATEPHVELAVLTWPRAGRVAWGELGGGPGHDFRDDGVRDVAVRPNDPALASFAVGPNPARDEVRARIALTSAAEVRCALYDLEGQIVRAARRSGNAGTQVELVFDVRDLAPGVYWARLELSSGGQRVRPVALRR
jgi:hypothetical protein